MPDQATPKPAKKNRPPILVRHAVSLGVVFVLALPASYYAGLWVNQQAQLAKLMSAEDDRFKQGIGYVVEHAWAKPSVQGRALQAVAQAEPTRAGHVLIALAVSFGQNELPVPDEVYEAITGLVERMTYTQAIGLYDGLEQSPGVDLGRVGRAVLASLRVEDDAELMNAVNLLEQRLLWSKQMAPRAVWIRWAVKLAESDAGLTQDKAAQLLGELPEDLADDRIPTTLTRLASSKHDTVRARVLAACAGYAAVADDPTAYEQAIFTLGRDKNNTIARRAWLVVGHLDPFSGYAMDWKRADPIVAEAVLWATAKTNPDRPGPVWKAYDDQATRAISLLALGVLPDDASAQRLNAALSPPEPEQIEIDIDRLIAAVAAGGAPPAEAFDLACVQAIGDRDNALATANRLVRANHPELRQLGALIAALSGTRPTLIRVSPQFLRENPDLDYDQLRDAGSDVLSELGLERVDALGALLEAADEAPPSANRRGEAKLLRLAMWVRGDLGDEFTPRAEAFLFDDALPTSTVLMCLLHKRRPVALDYLFGGLVTPRPDLHALFVQRRWWHVFSRVLDTADLPLWLWAGEPTQGFQLEAMRQWYAVNRWRIEDGAWPGPADD